MNEIASFIEKIHAFPLQGEGMDLIIVSCSTTPLASFWESHLNSQKGKILKKDVQIVAIAEDWPDGAGNAFGTLYALLQANLRIDIFDLLESGKSIAVYHTAGKGTRLAPLTLAEFNNKPAVVLPAVLKDDPTNTPLTILEMVIRQTAPFSSIMQGRVAVFWSDQIFIPNVPLLEKPTSHVEVFAKAIPIPTEQSFEVEGLSSYGMTTFDGKHLNKLTYSRFKDLNITSNLAINMGSFSLSKEFLKVLLNTYAEELNNKSSKLDTDNDLWMPGTLDKETFLSFKPHLSAQWEKVNAFKLEPFFSVRDIGEKAWWWDFGTVPSYYKNCMKLLNNDQEGEDLRNLFGHPQEQQDNLILGSSFKKSSIKNSILMHVKGNHLNLNRVICIKSDFSNLDAMESILYKVQSKEQEESFSSGAVKAHLFHSNLHLDASQIWEQTLTNNPCSFKDQYLKNQST